MVTSYKGCLRSRKVRLLRCAGLKKAKQIKKVKDVEDKEFFEEVNSLLLKNWKLVRIN